MREQNSYVLHSQSRKHTFIKLGAIAFNVKKPDWQLLACYQQNMSYFSQNLLPSSSPNQQVSTHVCKYEHQVPENQTWKTEYFISIYDKNPEELDKQKQKEGSDQSESSILLLKIQILISQVDKSFAINLLNMKDKGYIKFGIPVPIKPLPQSQRSQNYAYFGIFLNEEKNLQRISVQVQVKQEFLVQLTQKYHKYKRMGRIKPENSSQKNMPVQNLPEKIFISFLKKLKPISYFRDKVYSKSSENQNKQYARNKFNYFTFQSLNNQDRIFKVRKDSKIEQIYLDLNNTPGTTFDLDQQKTDFTPPPLQFAGVLKPYQSQALSWMLYRQGVEVNVGMNFQDKQCWANVGLDLGLQQDLLVNEQFQYVVWKQKIFKQCNGGILADDMGLGKTIMMISLILSHRNSKQDKTMIIAPLSVINVWESKLDVFAPYLKVVVANQKNLTYENVQEYDVVIVSPNKIKTEAGKTNNQFSVLLNYYWFRIILDEAHLLKNSDSVLFRCLYNLNSEYRWCVTGTPVQNSVHDIYSLIKFLRFEPWCFEESWQRRFPKDTSKKKTEGQEYLIQLKNILRGVMLRRIKQSKDLLGEPILSLPKIQYKINFVEMSNSARELYQQIDYKIESILKEGKEIKKNPEHKKKVFALIMRMRMVCAHQYVADFQADYVSYERFYQSYTNFLSKKNIRSMSIADWVEGLKNILSQRKYSCNVCQDIYNLVLAPCLHIFCKSCIKAYIRQKYREEPKTTHERKDKKWRKQQKERVKMFIGDCPLCQEPVSLKDLYPTPRINQFNRQLSGLKENQKMLSLITQLKKLRKRDKCLIFTSFLGMMRLIEIILKKNNFIVQTIQGDDSLSERISKINKFNNEPEETILIITFTTGALGLNLTEANNVFIMDPWWNPVVELQSIGRVQRMGQDKQVKVVKFITQHSIQVKILQYFIYKKKIVDSVLDIDDVRNDEKYSLTIQSLEEIYNMPDFYDEKNPKMIEINQMGQMMQSEEQGVGEVSEEDLGENQSNSMF